MRPPYLRQCLCLLSLIMFVTCTSRQSSNDSTFRLWDEIRDNDTLRIGTTTSPSVFFIYRGEEIGYEYSKLVKFAEDKRLSLDIHISNSVDTLRQWLHDGDIDLCITPFPMIKDNLDAFTFCGQVDTTALVLVQREGREPIRSVLNLKGDTVTVVANSAEALRLRQIDAEIGPDIDFHIMTVDTLSSEDLMSGVLDRSYNLTVVDQRLAAAYRRYHKGLDIETLISAPIRYSWVVDKGNTSLASVIDSFYMSTSAHTVTLSEVYGRYFYHKVKTPYAGTPKVKPGMISPYDDLFIEEARRLGWDWTILAAIAYQESRFNASVVGWSGAMGLMGIMPRTGRAFGASRDELLSPDVSVRVSVDCLLAFRKGFMDIEDSYNRICLTLAAYNAGIGHVYDACRLAEKHGYSPKVWEGNVRKFMLLKSNPEYYNDPVCKFGYLRGKETVAYVRDVMSRNNAYQAHFQSKQTYK